MKVSKLWSNAIFLFLSFLTQEQFKATNFVSVHLYVYHEHMYYPLCHSFDSPEFLSETFALYLTESTRKAQMQLYSSPSPARFGLIGTGTAEALPQDLLLQFSVPYCHAGYVLQ